MEALRRCSRISRVLREDSMRAVNPFIVIEGLSMMCISRKFVIVRAMRKRSASVRGRWFDWPTILRRRSLVKLVVADLKGERSNVEVSLSI